MNALTRQSAPGAPIGFIHNNATERRRLRARFIQSGLARKERKSGNSISCQRIKPK